MDLELDEIEASLATQGMTSIRNYFDVRILVKSPAHRYRLLLVMTFAWFGQFSGNNIASYYLPIMLTNVGITQVNLLLLMNAIYAVIGWIFATTGARFHDVWGRRKMLMGSCGAMAVCLAIVAGAAAKYQQSGSTEASAASIAFIFIFGAVFAFSFTPMQPIYPAEVLSSMFDNLVLIFFPLSYLTFRAYLLTMTVDDMRARGMMIFSITSGCAGFVNTFAAPEALKNITYWFYVFFAFWDVLECLFIYVFYVETKGWTLEELEEVFESSSPKHASLAR